MYNIIEFYGSKQIIYGIFGHRELDKIIELINIWINFYFLKINGLRDLYFSSWRDLFIATSLILS